LYIEDLALFIFSCDAATSRKEYYGSRLGPSAGERVKFTDREYLWGCQICLWTTAGNILLHFVAQGFKNLITFKITGNKCSSVKTFGYNGQNCTYLNPFHGFFSICSICEKCDGMSTHLIRSNFLAGMISQTRFDVLCIFQRAIEGLIQRLLSL